jgi:uncharacterized protein (TIGR03067 family)
MIRTALGVVAVSLLLGAARPDDAAKKELDRFTGTWQAVSVERDGKAWSKEDVAKVKLIVKGEHYAFHVGDETVKGMHKLDPTRDPKQIDAVRTEGPQAGETLKGIYTLDAENFKVCFAAPGKDRPTEFSSTAGGGHRLMAFKRSAPDGSRP